MDRRNFLTTGVGAAVGMAGELPSITTSQSTVRAAFPRLERERYLNAAAGTPLGAFAREGVQRYLDFIENGPLGGRRDYVDEMWGNVRSAFATLICAQPNEIALVPSTKAGEQVVIDSVDVRPGQGNIVTNDMHFAGSLHNLIGLRNRGVDVRIVQGDGWDVPMERMVAAIDRDTKLVCLTLVSNVTGRIEPVRQIAEVAHSYGALVYADIIQAAGIIPVDVRALNVDCAAANSYKWLFGVHGAAFLYVREDLHGSRLSDRVFPGHVRYNYAPWSTNPDPAAPPWTVEEPVGARRFEPGHVAYLAYCAAYEGLRFIQRLGLPFIHRHTLRLNQQLMSSLDLDRYAVITPQPAVSPIITLTPKMGLDAIQGRLARAEITVTVADGRIRISPAVYNTEPDLAALVGVLNG